MPVNNTFIWTNIGNFTVTGSAATSNTITFTNTPPVRNEPPMKTVELKHLPEEVAELVRMGTWTLYSYGANQYIVQTEAQNNCCNLHPQKTWLMDEDGLILKTLTALPVGAQLAKLV